MQPADKHMALMFGVMSDVILAERLAAGFTERTRDLTKSAIYCAIGAGMFFLIVPPPC